MTYHQTLFTASLLLTLALFSCETAPKESSSETTDEEQSDEGALVIESSEFEIVFDTSTMRSTSIEIVSAIARKPMPLTFKQLDRHMYERQWTQLTLIADSANSFWDFRISQYVSENQDDLTECLNLMRVAGADTTEERGVPGLSYANDYVGRFDNSIIQLHTGCYYAFFNHDKLKQALLNSVTDGPVQDSIVCRCGASCDD